MDNYRMNEVVKATVDGGWPIYTATEWAVYEALEWWFWVAGNSATTLAGKNAGNDDPDHPALQVFLREIR